MKRDLAEMMANATQGAPSQPTPGMLGSGFQIDKFIMNLLQAGVPQEVIMSAVGDASGSGEEPLLQDGL